MYPAGAAIGAGAAMGGAAAIGECVSKFTENLKPWLSDREVNDTLAPAVLLGGGENMYASAAVYTPVPAVRL